MTRDQVDELEALGRLAAHLAIATGGDGAPGVNAMARALAIRLATLAAGVRLA